MTHKCILIFFLFLFKFVNALLVWAAVTKYHGVDDLNNRHLSFMVLEAGSQRSKRWSVWFSVRALSLVCRRLPSHCVPT